jgi:hypothetical protein
MTSLSDIASKKLGKGKAAPAADTAPSPAPNAPVLDFFRVSTDAQGNFKSVTILQSKFRDLLFRLGFRRYDVGNGDFIIIRVERNIVSEYKATDLIPFMLRYVRGLDEDALREVHPFAYLKDELVEKAHRAIGTLTAPDKLAALVDMEANSTEIKIVEDTQDTAYYFYENGFVEVSKGGGIQLRPYEELPGYIWKDQILPRAFRKMLPSEYEDGAYYKFCCNVADNWRRTDGQRNNPGRFGAFCSITGYCLHRFFKTKLRTSIFLDARMSDDPDGRSGKSLHTKGLRQMLNADPEGGKQCIIIDGKEFNQENRFKYDELHPSTRLFVIDDVRRGLPIEMFFNAVVDGFVQELKGAVSKRRIWTKLILTLNYTIKIRGGSAKDRVVEFEFADYYSSQRSPEQEFGHWFFRDWDEVEWAKFDNFMLGCLYDYLLIGLISPETINLEARKLLDETSEGFIAFMLDLEIEHEKPYNKRELFNKFAEVDAEGNVRNVDVKRFLNRKVFTTWLRSWAQYRPEMAGYREHRSSGQDFITFFYNEPASAHLLAVGAASATLKLFPEKSGKVTAKEGGVEEVQKNLPF